MNLSTGNESFRQLTGDNVTYIIPPFQRDYSWNEENWEELWFDIEAMYSDDDDSENEHYMGYLVIQEISKMKQASIIDGQQRITTITILILSALSHLKKLISRGLDAENNFKREQVLRERFIGYTDPITLKSRSKLSLNKHNNRYFQSYIAVNADNLPSRNLKSSEHLLRKAYQWYEKKMELKFQYLENSGEYITSFIDSLVDKLFFTVIKVTDELNAFKVFETLNARGVKLSSTDLLKNYIFSVLSGDDTHDEILLDLEEAWERITGLLSNESFPELLRIFWNSKNKIVRKKDLFKVIRKSILTKESAYKLVRDLELSAEIYANLRDYNSPIWNDVERNAFRQLAMFGVKQPLAMLMSCYRAFFNSDRKTFTDVVNAISVISFRYNVICSLPPQDQEGIYSTVAIKIEKSELTSFSEITDSLRDVYPSDEQFYAAFKDKQLRTTSSRNQKVVQYILKSIEEAYAGNSIDLSTSKFNIEHILPQKAEGGWISFSDTLKEQYLYRIGNMLILETSINRKVANSSYDSKKVEYSKSLICLTRELAERFDSWSPETIESRQIFLAKQAKNIWRIQGL